MTAPISSTRYLRPGRFTRWVANPAARQLARWGKAPKGLRELVVPRRSGNGDQTLPVNLLELEGRRYLVAPRGETQWVRNIRVSGGGELRLGREVEPIAVTEVADADKPPILRAYLHEWRSEVKAFFGDLDANADHEALLAVAPGFPAFEVLPAPRS